jgi:hypothetical protein
METQQEGAWQPFLTELARAADLCLRPLRHGLRFQGEAPLADGASGTIGTDCILLIEARDPEGCRLCEGDLELEIYRSGRALHLMLTRLADDRWPMLWHGDHPVWMDPTNGLRCERPADGAPYEAFCRRVRDLLLQG